MSIATATEPDRVKLLLDAAEMLKNDCIAISFRKSKPGTVKTLTMEQKEKSAEPHGADARSLVAAKKLFDTRESHYSKVNGITESAHSYFKAISYQTSEPTVRIFPAQRASDLEDVLPIYQKQLVAAKNELDAVYPALIAKAKADLDELYDVRDYPGSLSEGFGFRRTFVNFTPPPWMLHSPQLLAEFESQKMKMYEGAVVKFEQSMIEFWIETLNHVHERLTGKYDDGKPFRFEDTTITKIMELADAFRTKDLNSNPELTGLLDSISAVFDGQDPKELRMNPHVRKSKAAATQLVLSRLDSLAHEVPDRAFYIE